VLKGSKTIKIPFNSGLVGHVFTTGETLNIMNAYNDSRFNREVDKLNNYKVTIFFINLILIYLNIL